MSEKIYMNKTKEYLEQWLLLPLRRRYTQTRVNFLIYLIGQIAFVRWLKMKVIIQAIHRSIRVLAQGSKPISPKRPRGWGSVDWLCNQSTLLNVLPHLENINLYYISPVYDKCTLTYTGLFFNLYALIHMYLYSLLWTFNRRIYKQHIKYSANFMQVLAK